VAFPSANAPSILHALAPIMLVIQVLPKLVHTGNSQDAKQQPHGRAVINASRLQHTAIRVQQVQSHGQFLAACSGGHHSNYN